MNESVLDVVADLVREAVGNERIADARASVGMEAMAQEARDIAIMLRGFAARLSAAVAWRPIETIPAEGDFLVYMPDERRKVHVAHWHPNVKTIGHAFAFDLTRPTHWMPLPPLPTTRGHDNG